MMWLDDPFFQALYRKVHQLPDCSGERLSDSTHAISARERLHHEVLLADDQAVKSQQAECPLIM